MVCPGRREGEDYRRSWLVATGGRGSSKLGCKLGVMPKAWEHLERLVFEKGKPFAESM